MRYPGYMLNPGDMFSVEPERVMFGIGAKKERGDAAAASREMASDEQTDVNEDAAKEAENMDAALKEAEADLREAEQSQQSDQEAPPEQSDDPTAATKRTLKSLRLRTKNLLDDPKSKKGLSGKQKQGLRALSRDIRAATSKAASTTPSTLDELEAQLETISSSLASAKSAPTESEEALSADASASQPDDTAEKTPELREAIKRIVENPVDASKPYLTPWRPRDWMSPFAFIPRYLEVNQNICSAVYLRHPFVYPGFSEVPTPFHPETGQLAFNWYLRRR